MDATELTQRLERRAGEAGFDAVGVDSNLGQVVDGDAQDIPRFRAELDQ